MSGAPVLLLTGPPGAGKSTVGPLVAARFDRAATLEADWFLTTIAGGFLKPWLPAADAQNHTVVRACAAAAAALSLGGYAVVVEGVLGPWNLPLLIDELQRARAEVHYVVLRPCLEVVLERAALRDERTRGISPLRDAGPLRQLWEQFSDLGPYESHVIDNGTCGPDETATLVWTIVENGTHRL